MRRTAPLRWTTTATPDAVFDALRENVVVLVESGMPNHLRKQGYYGVDVYQDQILPRFTVHLCSAWGGGEKQHVCGTVTASNGLTTIELRPGTFKTREDVRTLSGIVTGIVLLFVVDSLMIRLIVAVITTLLILLLFSRFAKASFSDPEGAYLVSRVEAALKPLVWSPNSGASPPA